MVSDGACNRWLTAASTSTQYPACVIAFIGVDAKWWFVMMCANDEQPLHALKSILNDGLRWCEQARSDCSEYVNTVPCVRHVMHWSCCLTHSVKMKVVWSQPMSSYYSYVAGMHSNNYHDVLVVHLQDHWATCYATAVHISTWSCWHRKTDMLAIGAVCVQSDKPIRCVPPVRCSPTHLAIVYIYTISGLINQTILYWIQL